MAGPGICVLLLVDTCASEVYPVFHPVAHYGYLLPKMYLLTTDIVIPNSFVCCCRTWTSSIRHTLVALKIYFPVSIVAPLPNSEQRITLPQSITPKHIYHHYAPSVTLTHHLFNCTHIHTTLLPLDLWTYLPGVSALLAKWTEKLVGTPQAGSTDSSH